MAAATGKLIVSAWLTLFSVVPLLGQKSNLHSAGNMQFEIVGLHARSVSYVDDLSRHIVQVTERYLDREALQFSQRILVSLKPEEYVDFEGDYIVRTGARGFVNLDLRWGASLSLLTTCRALSEALLVRYSIYNYGAEGPDFLPNWPATAIGMKAYFALRPAQSKQLSNWLDIEATPTVESLLERKWTDPVADVNAYALLLAMEQSGVERKTVRSLMAQGIAGANIAEALASQLQLSDPAAAKNLQLDEWWLASVMRLLAPSEEVMETMETSRLWIEALADFSNTEFEAFNLSQLWDARENEPLRDLIEARYRILRLRIVRVNPAYFNAARALGALFENYLAGDKRHKYVHSLTAFLGDFEDSKELEQTIIKALSEASAKSIGE